MPVDPGRRAAYGVRRSDPTIASSARVYDYLLGGSYAYEVDRQAADKFIGLFPLLRPLARYNRTWVQRVARYLVGQGVRQFLDIGSGIPTAGNVHEIVQDLRPTARVVYVDYESVAVNLGREILETNPYATSVLADMREPESILDNSEVCELLDFREPIAVIWGSMLHFLADEDDPIGMVAQYKQRLAPGSFVAISHGSEDLLEPVPLEKIRAFIASYNETVDAVITLRPVSTIGQFFDGTELVEPGLLPVPDWRPDATDDEPEEHNPARSLLLGGVGRLP